MNIESKCLSACTSVFESRACIAAADIPTTNKPTQLHGPT